MRTTRGLWCCALLFSALVGCTSGGGDGTQVYVTAQRTLLAAYREGNGPWQRLDIGVQGGTDIFVNEPFTVVGVCNDFGGEVYVYSGGPGDADEFWDVGCGPATDTALTITNSGGGTLWVNVGQYWSAYVTGTYTLQVPAGVHDMVLVDRDAHRVEVRRGFSVFNDTTIDVNLATTGVPMISRPLTGGTTTASWFRTASKVRGTLAFDTATAWSVPGTVSLPGDESWASARDIDSAMPRSRWRSIAVNPSMMAPLAVTIPAGLDTTTFTWTGLPTITYAPAGQWDFVSLTGYQNDADYAPLWYMEQYAGANAAPGTITFPDVATIPGWDSSWNVVGTQPWNMYLDLSRHTSDGAYEGASWDREVAPPAVRAMVERRDAMRLAAQDSGR
jgi:hypothetical protein